MKKIVSFCLSCLLLGCGYKPTSVASRQMFGKNVYVQVTISKRDPRNSVALKDAVNEAIVSRIQSNIVEKSEANTLLHVTIKSFKFLPIIYDKNGYATHYKTLVTLAIKTTFPDKKSEFFTTTGEYDFPIEANSVISDTKRYIAIKNASFNALDSYMAFIDIKGLSHGHNN